MTTHNPREVWLNIETGESWHYTEKHEWCKCRDENCSGRKATSNEHTPKIDDMLPSIYRIADEYINQNLLAVAAKAWDEGVKAVITETIGMQLFPIREGQELHPLSHLNPYREE